MKIQIPVTQGSILLGAITYCAYGICSDRWLSPYLIGVSAGQAFLLLPLAKLLNHVDANVVRLTKFETLGKLARFFTHAFSNILVVWLLAKGEVIDTRQLERFGNVFGFGLNLTAVSQGYQYVGIHAERRGIGEANANVLSAIGVTIVSGVLDAT